MARRILIMTNADTPSIFGVEMSAAVYILLGVLIALLIVIIGLSIKLHRVGKLQEPIEFRPSNNPPDEGITQRIYKPKGSPAVIHRGAVRRISRRRNRE